MVTDLQQATIADLQEKTAETHELLLLEEEGKEYASLSTQASQEATPPHSTQALQPAHESATSEEES